MRTWCENYLSFENPDTVIVRNKYERAKFPIPRRRNCMISIGGMRQKKAEYTMYM